MIFKDRVDAGIKLASALPPKRYGLVIAIAKGGIPVGRQISRILKIPLRVTVVRKIPISTNPEAGMGAVDESGSVILNPRILSELGLSKQAVEIAVRNVKDEITRRAGIFKKWLKPRRLNDLNIILTDDGLASGYTMLAAIKSAHRAKAAEITVAVPTCHAKAKELVAPKADNFVSLIIERRAFFAVADYYEHWTDLTDGEALEYLKNA